jgi:hydroxymethylbilane synthase
MNHVHAPRRLVIATRESALALWQAGHVRTRLEALYPISVIELLGVTTQGDRVIDRPLAAIGGKGLFVKELEIAMGDGRADLAVHSLKDLPMDLPSEFTLAAVVAREDPRDALVSNRYATLDELPAGAIVGTSSLRRESQLRERYPMLKVEGLRGNVNTRLRKLDAGQYDAMILAAAGLKRLGFSDRIRALLEPDDSLPAPGQGALALECRADRVDVITALSALSDLGTVLATTAERAFSRALSGSCTTPLAAYAQWEEGRLWIRGYIARRDGSDALRGEREAEVTDSEEAEALGVGLADEFLARGAARLVTTA